jgi:hypothetical protein
MNAFSQRLLARHQSQAVRMTRARFAAVMTEDALPSAKSSLTDTVQ